MHRDPFTDFDDRFDRQTRRIYRAQLVTFGLILAVWALVIATLIAAAFEVARLGPRGLAAEAGRAVAAFEQARESAR